MKKINAKKTTVRQKHHCFCFLAHGKASSKHLKGNQVTQGTAEFSITFMWLKTMHLHIIGMGSSSLQQLLIYFYSMIPSWAFMPVELYKNKENGFHK